MKKRNQKGFVLIEAIVVAVFVLSLFTFLFSNLVPLVGEYEAAENYDTINSIYNTNLIRTMIMSDSNVNSILQLNNPSYATNSYIKYEGDDICTYMSTTGQQNYCTKLLSSTFLNVNSIYVTWYRTGSIKNYIKDNPSNFPRAVREYVYTLEDFNQPTNSAYDSYKRIIVYFNDGTFANLEIKLKEV